MFFLVTSHLEVAVQPCLELIPFKKTWIVLDFFHIWSSKYGLYERQLDICRRFPPAEGFAGIDLKGWFLKLILQIKEVFLEILVSFTVIISIDLFVHFSRYSRSWKFLFNKHAFIWKKDINLFLLCNFSDCISLISKYLEFRIFSASTSCSGEEILNWLNKRARLGGGVKWIELFLLETFSDSF